MSTWMRRALTLAVLLLAVPGMARGGRDRGQDDRGRRALLLKVVIRSGTDAAR